MMWGYAIYVKAIVTWDDGYLDRQILYLRNTNRCNQKCESHFPPQQLKFFVVLASTNKKSTNKTQQHSQTSSFKRNSVSKQDEFTSQ